jgi:membrane fusion protein, multidrug efflux system
MNKTTKRIIYIGIALVVVALLAIPKLDFLKAEENRKTAASPQASSRGIPVRAVVAKEEVLDNVVVANGTIFANEEVLIASEMAGRVTKINFKEGDKVKKGTVLVRINDDEMRAQLQRLEYQRQLFQQSEDRQRRLLAREAISQQEYDVALTQLNTSVAEIENIKAQLNKSIIRAPFDGTIGLRYVSEGSFIPVNTRIANLVNTNPAKLDISIPGRYSQSVRVGDKIRFVMEGYSKEFEATIYAVEPTIDPTTRTLQIRAITPNPSDELMPGAFVTAELVLKQIEKAILVPTEAVVPELNGHIVYLHKNGKAEPKRVEIGTRNPQNIEIREGLQPGDTIITTGILQMRPGIDVRIESIKL